MTSTRLTLMLILLASPVCEATVWTDWTTYSVGNPGTASGSLNGIAVSYVGEVTATATRVDGSSRIWSPDSTWIGGPVTSSPSIIGDAISLQGGYRGINVVTFSAPVLDPTLAVWSLGRTVASGGYLVTSSFLFDSPPSLNATGPSADYGLGVIAISGLRLDGAEGNATITFPGEHSSLSWTQGEPEYYYAFTVGAGGAIPEPGSLALVLIGIAAFALHYTRRAYG